MQGANFKISVSKLYFEGKFQAHKEDNLPDKWFGMLNTTKGHSMTTLTLMSHRMKIEIRNTNVNLINVGTSKVLKSHTRCVICVCSKLFSINIQER